MDRPPVFADEGLDHASQRAAASGRWLIVDATAPWCQPCKLMDRTTWRDPAVEAWIASRAIAVQVDVDAEATTAQGLAIAAMPTVIALREGKEKDRVVGYQTAAGLLEWFARLERGESSLDQLRRSLLEPERDMHGRLKLAQALLHARRHDEAADEYVWLWNNMTRVNPGMVGVRVSFMAHQIATLVGAHAGARARFISLRDQTEVDAGRTDADATVRFDWLVLNELLGDDERTIAWFDAAKDDPQQAEALEKAAHRLTPKLRARGRWADIARLHRDPLGHLQRAHKMLLETDGLPPDALERMRAVMAANFRNEAAVLYASMRAAGRSEDAAAVEREALRLDPSAETKAAIAAAATASALGVRAHEVR